MYRLTFPNLIIFIPLIIVGIIFSTVIPNYIPANRILSVISLLIGQIGMSFVPVIALFPKANLTQSFILSLIYFLTTFIICVAAWVLYTLGLTPEPAFEWKYEQFYVNVASILISNSISFFSLFLCFKLVYDEELTKSLQTKAKHFKGFTRKFSDFQSHLLKRPVNETQIPKPRGSEVFEKKNMSLEDDFGKPFEFEPEGDLTSSSLPIESSGSLFNKEVNIKTETSEFFDDYNESISSEPIKPRNLNISTKSTETLLEEPIKKTEMFLPQPTDIKEELSAIFEQYSSLDAVKKLTTNTAEEIKQKVKESLEENLIDVGVKIKIDESNIEEGLFRDITKEENLKDVKEELKKELKEEIQAELNLKQQVTQHEELPLQENIFQGTVEVIEVQEVEAKVPQDPQLSLILNNIVSEDKVLGAIFFSMDKKIIAQNLKALKTNTDVIKSNFLNLIEQFNLQLNTTNQGNLSHVLLESELGILLIAIMEDKILLIVTEGNSELYIAKLLRLLSKVEESL